ncbi:hypothetical protein SAMN05192540_2952 [Maribacter dokdonensis]|uniref:Uncharacterized protein n=1 Tax=Maribacter dokdonensis TaxID=320912 RepID=A0A1H4RSN4_9FLAO|nr:hypothetical protein [Maribacter dokdonensis]SEC34912.1 hypothetical protein SAMN05192540_2952 [Maribacter dokdonensis]
MKNKRTFLASIALGVFLLAMAAPVINIDKQDTNVDKRELTKRI